MLAATYRVTIERHEVRDIPALVFQCDMQDQSPYPLVFVIHGLTSRKERHLDLCLRLAHAGFRVCSFDTRSHGERRDDEAAVLFGDRHDPAFAPTFIRAVMGTVQDLMELADYFGASQYTLVGHSMGGYIAMQTALADPRAQAVVNIAGSIDISTRTVPENLVAEYGDIIALADVAARTAELKPRPILLLHGEQDETVPFEGALRLYTALKEAYGDQADQVKLVRYPDMGHHDFPASLSEEAITWLSKIMDRGSL